MASLDDEPLPGNAEVDWNRAYDLARDRRDAERERLERIESKIAPIIAGSIAALGLFIDKASGWTDFLVGALLLVPIALLLRAFRTTDYLDFPNLDNLVETYQWYPKTYVRSTVLGAADSISKNSVIIDRKARELNRAMVILFVTVVVIIGWRASEAFYSERLIQAHATASPAPTASASAATAAPNARRTARSTYPAKHASMDQKSSRI